MLALFKKHDVKNSENTENAKEDFDDVYKNIHEEKSPKAVTRYIIFVADFSLDNATYTKSADWRSAQTKVHPKNSENGVNTKGFFNDVYKRNTRGEKPQVVTRYTIFCRGF